MIGHPLPGHRWAQVTRNFSDPELEEQEALLRNAAPELLQQLKNVEPIVRKHGHPLTHDFVLAAIAKAEGKA